jgi:hypothetical protein
MVRVANESPPLSGGGRSALEVHVELNEPAIAEVFAAWEPACGHPREEAWISIDDVFPLAALAGDRGVFPQSLLARPVNDQEFLLLWTATDVLWLQLEEVEFRTIGQGPSLTGARAVKELFASMAEVYDQKAPAIRAALGLDSLREHVDTVRAAADGDSNDEEIDAGHALADCVDWFLEQFAA